MKSFNGFKFVRLLFDGIKSKDLAYDYYHEELKYLKTNYLRNKLILVK